MNCRRGKLPLGLDCRRGELSRGVNYRRGESFGGELSLEAGTDIRACRLPPIFFFLSRPLTKTLAASLNFVVILVNLVIIFK